MINEYKCCKKGSPLTVKYLPFLSKSSKENTVGEAEGLGGVEAKGEMETLQV